MADSLQTLNAQQRAEQITLVCRAAVEKAQAESRRLGVANFYVIDGKPCYEMPNGEFTHVPPVEVQLPADSYSSSSEA